MLSGLIPASMLGSVASANVDGSPARAKYQTTHVEDDDIASSVLIKPSFVTPDTGIQTKDGDDLLY